MELWQQSIKARFLMEFWTDRAIPQTHKNTAGVLMPCWYYYRIFSEWNLTKKQTATRSQKAPNQNLQYGNKGKKLLTDDGLISIDNYIGIITNARGETPLSRNSGLFVVSYHVLPGVGETLFSSKIQRPGVWFSVMNYTLAKVSQTRHFGKTNELNIHSNYRRVIVRVYA